MQANKFTELVNNVCNLFNLTELNDDQRKIIISYIDEYLVAWEEYRFDASFENTSRLQVLSIPIHEIYSSDKSSPAIDIIKSHISMYGTKIENSQNSGGKTNEHAYVRTLVNNANKGHKLTDDNDNIFTSNAAFWQAPLIITLCIIFGIIIAVLLK